MERFQIFLDQFMSTAHLISIEIMQKFHSTLIYALIGKTIDYLGFSFFSLVIIADCCINCSKALAQLKPIHALGCWVAQKEILWDAKHCCESIYKIEKIHTHTHRDLRKQRHSREKLWLSTGKWKNMWTMVRSPKSTLAKMRCQ